jgi:DNA-binding MarR family transcriptional regulator
MDGQKKSSSFTTSNDPPLIGALLRVPWEAVRARMLTRLHESGFDDFEPAHFTVFRYPSPDGARPSELAARLGISKQALNYLLRELERLGYLERRPDPDDLRGKRITVTPRGRSAVRVIRAAVAELEQEWAEELGARRFAQLRSLLVELNRLA